MKALLIPILALLSPLDPISTVRAGDAVRWNEIATHASAAAQTDPLTESRHFAILHLAIHDAVNAVEPRFATYLAPREAERGASASAAAAAAAHEVLVALYPKSRASFDLGLEESLRALGENSRVDAGIALGRVVARDLLAARRHDGFDRPVAFRPGTKAGAYRPTPPDFTPAAFPQWGGIEPFALDSSAQFRPAPPPAVDGEQARAEVALVRSIGAEKRSIRDDEQSEIARYWYEHSTQGWNRIAREVAQARSLDLHDGARLLALVNVAMADGFIAGFEAKYHYNYWRPATAIREAGDREWLSYLITPPVPDYPSTHTVLGAAAAAVLERFFGSDYVPFRMTSGEPYAGITRGFWSFSEAARENGASRVFAGLHFPAAVEAGYAQGDAVGAWAFEHALRPLK